MLMEPGDRSVVRYVRSLPTMKTKHGRIEADIVARGRYMFLHGKVSKEDGSEVELATDTYFLHIYCLRIREYIGISEKPAHSYLYLCGLKRQDVCRAWDLLQRYNGLSVQDYESVLEQNGFPRPKQFDEVLARGLAWFASKHGITQNRVNKDDITMIESRPIDTRGKPDKG